jgi:hypothetical protein
LVRLIVSDHLHPIDEQARLLAEADIGPPAAPAVFAAALIECRAEDGDGDASLHDYPKL